MQEALPALAQAALRSKKGISASIESQEAQNQKLKAQGEQRVNDVKMEEQLRLQGIDMAEAKRMQQAEAMGKDYVFQEQESRELVALDRAQAKVDGANANLQAAQDAKDAAVSGLVTGAVGAIGPIAGAIDSKGKDWYKQ